jgi:hypothetical protein
MNSLGAFVIRPKLVLEKLYDLAGVRMKYFWGGWGDSPSPVRELVGSCFSLSLCFSASLLLCYFSFLLFVRACKNPPLFLVSCKVHFMIPTIH